MLEIAGGIVLAVIGVFVLSALLGAVIFGAGLVRDMLNGTFWEIYYKKSK